MLHRTGAIVTRADRATSPSLSRLSVKQVRSQVVRSESTLSWRVFRGRQTLKSGERKACALFVALGAFDFWATECAAESERTFEPVAEAATVEEEFHPVSKVPAPTFGAQPRGFAQRALGVRMGLTNLSGGQNAEPTFGGSLYERGVGLFVVDGFSARYFDELWIGGDSRDLTYSLNGQLAVGPQFKLWGDQGPVLRAAVRAMVRQEGGLYLSALRVPGAELGWQALTKDVEVEFVGHIAPLLTGVWQIANDRAQLGGTATGISTSFSLYPFRLDLDWNVYLENPDPWTVAEFRGNLCFFLGKQKQRPTFRTGDPRRALHLGPQALDYRWSICSDVGSVRALGVRGNTSAVSLWSVGFSLLVGTFSVLDPVPL